MKTKIMIMVITITLSLWFVSAMHSSSQRTHAKIQQVISELEYPVGAKCGMYIVKSVSVPGVNDVFTDLMRVDTGEVVYFYSSESVRGFCQHEFNNPEYITLLRGSK